MFLEILTVATAGASILSSSGSRKKKREQWIDKLHDAWLADHQRAPTLHCAPPGRRSSWWYDSVREMYDHSDYYDDIYFRQCKRAYIDEVA